VNDAADTLKGRDAIQRDLDKLKKWHMCTCNTEDQPYPGLHQEKREQQVEGGDSAPLLCSGETLPGVLHPALDPSAQEGHGIVGAGPEQSHKNDQRAGAPLL